MRIVAFVFNSRFCILNSFPQGALGLDIPAEAHVSALVQAGMPKHVAEVFAEMYAGFASGRIQPKGDRLVQGKTTLDEVIKTLVA